MSSHWIPEATVGIDAGATLCKVVLQGKTLETARYSSADLALVRSAVQRLHPKRIAATGGGAGLLGADLDGVAVQRVSEFEAWARGAPILAALSGVEIPDSYLLVSLGTGTSILAVREGTAERVGGSALGGGTLVGLGQLLVRTSRFEELVRLAGKGDRRRVDLLVGDIYRNGGISLPAELNAASFGKLASETGGQDPRREDVAHALMGMLGENIGLICGAAARYSGTSTILYCGSTLADNPALEDVVRGVTLTMGCRPMFFPEGAYCGAVGAAALLGSEA